jgi:diadenylate cyclase
LVTLFSRLVQLPTFSSIVRIALPALLISIPIIFQPELRRIMERLGRAGRLRGRPVEGGASDALASIVALAARRLAESRHGALFVIERDTGLDDLAERGVILNADTSVDLLTQLFHPNTPLHDGAVILREGRVVAARVVLPIRDAPLLDERLGTRHLAAVSVSESTDALAVVVSEETGHISLAIAGRLIAGLDEGELSRQLRRHLSQPPSPAGRLLGPLLRAATFEGSPLSRQGAEAAVATDDGGEPVLGASEEDTA